MKTLTEILIDHALADRFIRASRLDQLLAGSAKRRYGLVNRALKSGELLRIQRGLYVLADRYRTRPFHSFALAQAIAPGSYISFETALAYHGWIPERVFTTSSVVPGRKTKRLENELAGVFSFHPLALQTGYFLELVSRVTLDEQVVLIAKPLRALMDLVYLRKIAWEGMDLFVEGLRIDSDLLESVTRENIQTLKMVYKHKRMKSFLISFSRELDID